MKAEGVIATTLLLLHITLVDKSWIQHKDQIVPWLEHVRHERGAKEMRVLTHQETRRTNPMRCLVASSLHIIILLSEQL